MTYEEAYRSCGTVKEIEEMVKKDIAMAMLVNRDRIPIIQKIAQEVINDKINDSLSPID